MVSKISLVSKEYSELCEISAMTSAAAPNPAFKICIGEDKEKPRARRGEKAESIEKKFKLYSQLSIHCLEIK